MKVLAILTPLIALLSVADACGIWGQLFCDYCWEGGFTSGLDTYIANAQVFANCTFSKNAATYLSYWGSDATGSDGSFQAPITGASNYNGQYSAEASFMSLFNSFDVTKGLASAYKLEFCTISVTGSSACPTLALNDGTFLTTGKPGNGITAKATIARYLKTAYADIYISAGALNSVAMTPTTKGGGKTCPASPPPPPGLKGDPHFTGADGSHFDFTGEPGNNYCLVSDSHVHINAYYGGRFDKWGDNTHKALTWIRKIGVLWGEHTVTLAVREGARWQYDNGYMSSIEVDGEAVNLREEGDSVSLLNGEIGISWLAAAMKSADDLVDVYMLRINGVGIMRLTLRPEIALLRTEDDAVIHFDVEFPKVDLSASAHGVLGQTFRPEQRNKLRKQKLVYSELLNTEVIPGDNAESFLDGKVEDYLTSGLLQADCKFAKFNSALRRNMEAKAGMQLTSGSAVSTNAVGRKMLKKVFAA